MADAGVGYLNERVLFKINHRGFSRYAAGVVARLIAEHVLVAEDRVRRTLKRRRRIRVAYVFGKNGASEGKDGDMIVVPPDGHASSDARHRFPQVRQVEPVEGIEDGGIAKTECHDAGQFLDAGVVLVDIRAGEADEIRSEGVEERGKAGLSFRGVKQDTTKIKHHRALLVDPDDGVAAGGWQYGGNQTLHYVSRSSAYSTLLVGRKTAPILR